MAVDINTDLLLKEMHKNGESPKTLTKKLGMSAGWFSGVLKTPRVLEKTETSICYILGRHPGYFINKNNYSSYEKDGHTASKLEDVLAAIKSIQSELEKISATQDKIYSKVQANTIQIEKLKDMWK